MKKDWQKPTIFIVKQDFCDVIMTSTMHETGVDASDWFNIGGEE